jgi:hypothetical protein
MKRIFRQTLTPSFAVSVLALAVALGGGAGYALAGVASPSATSIQCRTITHFLNGWRNFPTHGFIHKAEFCRDSLGYVHLDGVLVGGIPGSAAFRVPSGDQPMFDHFFAVAAGNAPGSGPALVHVEVHSNAQGEGSQRNEVIVIDQQPTAWVGLDGVTYAAPCTCG